MISYVNEWEGHPPQMGTHPLLCLLTVPWNCPATSVCVFKLVDKGLVDLILISLCYALAL